MIIIKKECVDNAVGMLSGRFSHFLGWVGNGRYYLVDGVAWYRGLDGVVARAESPEETEWHVKRMRNFDEADAKREERRRGNE